MFGGNCVQQKQTLEKCVRECFNSTDAKKFDRDSILCYECLLKLNNLVKYEKEIHKLKQDIFDLLSKLEIDPGHHKRLCPAQAMSIAKKPKHICNSTSNDASSVDTTEISTGTGASTLDDTTTDGM